jgi:8-oxo-dGTP pyrophosphatase MutT (NUDIX family)
MSDEASTDTVADIAADIAAGRAKRLTDAARDRSFAYLRPRDAATLILVDRSHSVPKVLLGRRHQGHKFMPGKFVFPGGRVEIADRAMPTAAPLHDSDVARLMRRMQRPSPAKAAAFALAAIRETYEETGLMLGVRRTDKIVAPSGAWSAFAEARILPDLGALHFITRAITPPGRPRRFDSRFFAADVSAVAHRAEGIVGPDAELVELVWLPITEARRLDMPTITAVALEELQDRAATGMSRDHPVPFFRMLHNRFVRETL